MKKKIITQSKYFLISLFIIFYFFREAVNMTKKFNCNCAKSGCIKKYCECFANGELCDFKCDCHNCGNCSTLNNQLTMNKTNSKIQNINNFHGNINSNKMHNQFSSSNLTRNSKNNRHELNNPSNIKINNFIAMENQNMYKKESNFKPKYLPEMSLYNKNNYNSIKIESCSKNHKNEINTNHHHHNHTTNSFVAENQKKEFTCTCTKSNCQKNYCDCFKNGQLCGDNCRCIECKNTKDIETKLKPEKFTIEYVRVHVNSDIKVKEGKFIFNKIENYNSLINNNNYNLSLNNRFNSSTTFNSLNNKNCNHLKNEENKKNKSDKDIKHENKEKENINSKNKINKISSFNKSKPINSSKTSNKDDKINLKLKEIENDCKLNSINSCTNNTTEEMIKKEGLDENLEKLSDNFVTNSHVKNVKKDENILLSKKRCSTEKQNTYKLFFQINNGNTNKKNK
jgi:hypothetical protein